MILEASLDLNAGQIVTGLAEPTGISTHSSPISASTSGYFAITDSGTARSLGKNNGPLIY